jgi:hypothetical protein
MLEYFKYDDGSQIKVGEYVRWEYKNGNSHEYSFGKFDSDGFLSLYEREVEGRISSTVGYVYDYKKIYSITFDVNVSINEFEKIDKMMILSEMKCCNDKVLTILKHILTEIKE